MRICQKCGTQYEGAISFCPRDGEALGDDHAEMIGRILDGQYEIEQFIAEGGMGAVYRARHTLLGDRVAIKILPPEMRRNTAWLKRFQREGQAARRFQHPNSVIVHDLRTSEDGDIYLVMQYVEGRTLDEEVAARGGHLSLAETLLIIEPIASVLDAAHAQGVVHRDLKPSNIMITKEGNLKLLDLGIAKVSDMEAGASQLTVTGQLLGTPYYMSPEQWGELPRDGSEEIDGRTDVYSLGVVIYQITAGEFPFKGDSVLTLRRAHCEQNPRPLEEMNPNVPAAWSRAVLRAMSKDRNDRQRTAGELATELRTALHGVSQTAENVLPVTPTIMGERRDTPRAMHKTPPHLVMSTIDARANTFDDNLSAVPYNQEASFEVKGQKPRHTARIFIAVAAFLILAASVYALWQWRASNRAARRRDANQAKSSQSETREQSASPATAIAPGDERAASTNEVFMRYHLLLDSSLFGESVRASGRDLVATGQIVRFVFNSRESGYLYMLGHDTAGNPIVIPLGNSEAVAKIEAGADAVYPSLPLIKLDATSGTERFTVIFSDQPLPFSFASSTLPVDGSFRKLEADDIRKIEDLRQQAVPVTIGFEGSKENETAIVRRTGERGSKPVVFDIKLKLQR